MFNNIGKPWPEHEPWFSRTTARRVVGILTDLSFPVLGLIIAFVPFTVGSFYVGLSFFCLSIVALIGEV